MVRIHDSRERLCSGIEPVAFGTHLGDSAPAGLCSNPTTPLSLLSSLIRSNCVLSWQRRTLALSSFLARQSSDHKDSRAYAMESGGKLSDPRCVKLSTDSETEVSALTWLLVTLPFALISLRLVLLSLRINTLTLSFSLLPSRVCSNYFSFLYPTLQQLDLSSTLAFFHTHHPFRHPLHRPLLVKPTTAWKDERSVRSVRFIASTCSEGSARRRAQGKCKRGQKMM